MPAIVDKQLHAFIQYLKIEKRCSEHTLKNYRRDLLKLQHFCSEQQISCWGDVQTNTIRQYIAQRHRKGISSKTLQRELSATRSFFHYLLSRDLVSKNPAKQIQAPKENKTLPKTLDVDQVCGILEAQADSILEIRDLAMFELFYSSGLRLSELAAVNISDIDLNEQMLRVRSGKGGKGRKLPVGGKAVKAINNWLSQRPHTSDPALFTGKHGKRLNQRSIQLRLDRWCRKNGVSEHVHPHMLRHSFASHLLQSSQDIRAVQDLLGHSNISSTQIYTHLDFQHLAEIYDKAHPRARKNIK